MANMTKQFNTERFLTWRMKLRHCFHFDLMTYIIWSNQLATHLLRHKRKGLGRAKNCLCVASPLSTQSTGGACGASLVLADTIMTFLIVLVLFPPPPTQAMSRGMFPNLLP